jgi:pimeloyl-ACP methyl ester carboxylesterase
MKTPHIKIIGRSLLRYGFLLISLALASPSSYGCEPCEFNGSSQCQTIVADATETFATSDSSDAVPLCWDVYLPIDEVFSPPWHVIVIIHGGGFEQNKRNNGNIPCIAQDLVESGFAVVSISYRLDKITNESPCGQEDAAFSPQYAPHDQISDVKKGIIAASRGEIVGGTSILHGNVTGKVAAIGGSAGGAHAAWCAATGTNNNDRLDAAVLLSGSYKFDDQRSIEEGVSEFCRKVEDYCMVLEETCIYDDLSDDDRRKLHDGSPLFQIGLVSGVPNVCPIYAFDTTRDPMPQWQLNALVTKLDSIAPGDPNYLHLRFEATDNNVHSFSYWFDHTIPTDPNSPTVNELAKDFLHDHLDAP